MKQKRFYYAEINENNIYYVMLKMKDIEIHGKGFTKTAIHSITKAKTKIKQERR